MNIQEKPDHWSKEEWKRYVLTGMLPVQKKKKPSKYLNKISVIDGIKFRSIKEGNRWLYWKSEWQKGRVKKVERQVVFKLVVNGIQITRYIADFVIWNLNGSFEVEDVKSEHTAELEEFKMKKALMKAIYNVDVKVVI